jgi:hypothetical protein
MPRQRGDRAGQSPYHAGNPSFGLGSGMVRAPPQTQNSRFVSGKDMERDGVTVECELGNPDSRVSIGAAKAMGLLGSAHSERRWELARQQRGDGCAGEAAQPRRNKPSLTPTAKPPPMAVRITEAMP